MKLRTKLILAFLLLSVVPLAGATLYSYRSSLAAFQKAVEREAGAMTDEMSSRMEVVTADLGRRMERLESLPYEALWGDGQPRQDGSDQEAGLFLARLKQELGEVAPLVESIEYTPVVASTAETPRTARTPETGRTPRTPRTPRVTSVGAVAEVQAPEPPEPPEPPEAMEPVVIHLNRMLFRDQEIDIDGDEEGVASIAVDGKNLVLLPGRLMEQSGDPAAVERAIGDIFQSLELIDSEEFDGLMEQIVVSVETKFEQVASAAKEATEARDLERRHVERRLAAQQLASREMAVAFAHATEEMARALDEAASDEAAAEQDTSEPSAAPPAHRASSSSSVVFGREAAVRALDSARRRMPRLKIEGELGADIEQDGETIGRVRAQVNEAEVLRSVLSRTRRDQGEIAFALGQDGTIFAPDPQDQEQLEQLQLAGLVADGGQGGDGSSAQLQGNWVIVTRQVPDQELVFGIARPVGESLDEIRSTARQNMGWGLALVGVAMLGIIPLSGRMTRNLSRLTDGATQMAGGNLDVRVPVRSSDEFGQLARAFNNMGASLEQHQRQRVEQERLRKELEMCRQIQEEMLPQGASRLPFGEVRALSIPAREVGGDFFNYFTLDNGDVALLVGDVSGKGVPAALMMANLQATLRARLPLEPNLATLAERLDGEIEGGTRSKDYVTLFMGVIDPSSMVLRYVNAGHNTQYVLGQGGRVEPLGSIGRPLGLLSGGGYREQEVQLEPGDFVFLFTDGLVEAENEAGEPFGEERLAELLRRERKHAAAGVLERVERALADYRGEAEPADDATMMVVHLGA